MNNYFDYLFKSLKYLWNAGKMRPASRACVLRDKTFQCGTVLHNAGRLVTLAEKHNHRWIVIMRFHISEKKFKRNTKLREAEISREHSLESANH